MKIQWSPFSRITILFFLSLISNPVLANHISVKLPNNTIANADFRVGIETKPAVFLLHGFMSTYSLNIIQTIAEELEDKEYTVLAPTLSLNINNRRSGANCDAVHTHTMESDVNEIAWWIDWLVSKGHNKIVLVGFSTGALQVSVYLNTHQSVHIQKAILLSPAYLAGKPFSPEMEKKDTDKAKKMLVSHEKQLQKFSLSYCRSNFLAPPKVYLSYKAWTVGKLLESIEKISIPKSVIIGSNDHRFEIHLDEKLKKTKARLISIDGAGHFFDSPYEFEFLEQFMKEIETK